MTLKVLAGEFSMTLPLNYLKLLHNCYGIYS